MRSMPPACASLGAESKPTPPNPTASESPSRQDGLRRSRNALKTATQIGTDPFDPVEIESLVTTTTGAIVTHVGLADDPLSAAVLCGRTGVSARRLRRLPLMRSAAAVAGRLHLSSLELVR